MSAQEGPSAFPATLWTLVRRIGSSPEAEQQHVLNQLCSLYWHPIYHYARRQGKTAHDAQDLTQGFFLYILENQLLERADQNKGKLRTYLLIAFNRYMWGEYDKSTAAKRGGKDLHLTPLQDAEENFLADGGTHASPEEAYDRQCAQRTLSAAMDSLQSAMKAAGKESHFHSLKQYFIVSGNEQSYTQEATALGTNYANYKMMVQRFRTKFKEVLKAQVAQTLPEGASEEHIHEETLAVIRLAF